MEKSVIKGSSVGAGIILLAIIYSALLFVLKKEFDLSAWILFAFTVLAFLCVFLQVMISLNVKQEGTYSAVTIMVTLVYWAIQFFLGGIVCMFFEIRRPEVVLVAEAGLLILYLILLFVLNGAHSHALRQEADQSRVQKLRLLETEVRDIADMQSDPEIKSSLALLADDLHYADAFVHEDLETLDEMISEGISRIRYMLELGNGNIESIIKEIRVTIKERNRKAAFLKQ